MIAEAADCREAAKMAAEMWTDHDPGELAEEFETLAQDPEAVLFLYREGEKAVGFAQCQLRHDYVEGTDSRWGIWRASMCVPASGGAALPKRC